MAEQNQVAFSAITHPPKASSQRAIDHYIGSQAFIAAARIGHLCIAEVDNDKPTGRILFTMAATNNEVMPTLAYRIRSVTVGQDPQTRENITPPYVVWEEGEVRRITADQAIAAAGGNNQRDRQALTEAKAFLRQELANGPRLAEEIKTAASGAGLTLATIRRAKFELRIEASKVGLQGPWVWGLPDPAEEPF
jgi:putative DNA primase/helicase